MAVSSLREKLPMFDLQKYKSPPWETSLYKGIPIEDIEVVRAMMKLRGINYRFRFRGPRGSKRYQSYIPKTMAKTFAVYDNDYRY
jgi:hypothetical protein